MAAAILDSIKRLSERGNCDNRQLLEYNVEMYRFVSFKDRCSCKTHRVRLVEARRSMKSQEIADITHRNRWTQTEYTQPQRHTQARGARETK